MVAGTFDAIDVTDVVMLTVDHVEVAARKGFYSFCCLRLFGQGSEEKN